MNDNNIIIYEYRDITVKRNLEPLYFDSLPHFGWLLEGSVSAPSAVTHVTLKFKRDRKIKNKADNRREILTIDIAV